MSLHFAVTCILYLCYRTILQSYVALVAVYWSYITLLQTVTWVAASWLHIIQAEGCSNIFNIPDIGIIHHKSGASSQRDGIACFSKAGEQSKDGIACFSKAGEQSKDGIACFSKAGEQSKDGIACFSKAEGAIK